MSDPEVLETTDGQSKRLRINDREELEFQDAQSKRLRINDPEELAFQDGQPEIAASYQYVPLPTREHTRVLVLEPGPNDDNKLPLVSSLRLLDLRDEDSEPFEAISYVWGSSEKTHVILVDGLPLPITASLREALLQTRLPHRPRRLWADAICINQSDKNEKGHQVFAMGRIYKRSKRTLICLGTRHPKHAQHAANLIEYMTIMIRNAQKGLNFSVEPGIFPFPAKSDEVLHDSRWELGWNVLVCRRWFSRGWVVQEALLGPDAYVLWASVQISFTSVLRVNNWLVYRGYSAFQSQGRKHPDTLARQYFRSFARLHPEETRLFSQKPRNKMLSSTLGTLSGARRFHLFDPRDRIYAFMALDTSDGFLADLRLDPDYERPFWEIYHEFAIKYLETFGDLNILSFIKHSMESSTGPTLVEAIPSWVPRWDLRVKQKPYGPKMVCHPKPFKFAQKHSVLQVRGLILGSVEYCATQELWCQHGKRSLALQNVISLWKEVVAVSNMNGAPYEGRQALAFFDVLCPSLDCGTFEEWSAWRQEFALHLQSYIPGPEPGSAISVSQQCQLVPEQLSLKTLAEAIRGKGPRQFVILSRGYFGTAPPITQKGDVFALIYGSETLSILRPAKGKPGYYQIVGPIYAESRMVKHSHRSNMMGKEGRRDWEEWGLEEQDINLC